LFLRCRLHPRSLLDLPQSCCSRHFRSCHPSSRPKNRPHSRNRSHPANRRRKGSNFRYIRVRRRLRRRLH
jgi:hypothetical protein